MFVADEEDKSLGGAKCPWGGLFITDSSIILIKYEFSLYVKNIILEIF